MHVLSLSDKTKNEIKTFLFLRSRQRRTTEQKAVKEMGYFIEWGKLCLSIGKQKYPVSDMPSFHGHKRDSGTCMTICRDDAHLDEEKPFPEQGCMYFNHAHAVVIRGSVIAVEEAP